MEACTSGFGALCVSRFDAARQIMVLQSLVTLLQDKLERADVRAALLQDELDEAEKGRVRAKDRRSHCHLIDTLTSIARISLRSLSPRTRPRLLLWRSSGELPPSAQ